MVIVLSVCVIVHETLSTFWNRGERPWLLLLSSDQVPAKLVGAAACTARANTSALIRLRAQSNFLIQDLLRKCWLRERAVYQNDMQTTVRKRKDLYSKGK